jgi:hypothetical protein
VRSLGLSKPACQVTSLNDRKPGAKARRPGRDWARPSQQRESCASWPARCRVAGDLHGASWMISSRRGMFPFISRRAVADGFIPPAPGAHHLRSRHGIRSASLSDCGLALTPWRAESELALRAPRNAVLQAPSPDERVRRQSLVGLRAANPH